MLDNSSRDELRAEIRRLVGDDRRLLDELRGEIRPLASATKRILPHSTTSISLVAADGGNNQLRFDPFLVQIVRVVDSSNNEYCLEVLSPTTSVCVVDVSQMRGTAAFVLAGIVLRRIFDRNQFEFTRAEPKTIPTIAVIEEAQTVLNEKAAAAEPFIAWVKEGRKYDLSAVLVGSQLLPVHRTLRRLA